MPDWGVHGMGAGGSGGSAGTHCWFSGGSHCGGPLGDSLQIYWGLIPGVPWFHVPFSLSVDLGLEAAALGFCPSEAGLQILFKFPMI